MAAHSAGAHVVAVAVDFQTLLIAAVVVVADHWPDWGSPLGRVNAGARFYAFFLARTPIQLWLPIAYILSTTCHITRLAVEMGT